MVRIGKIPVLRGLQRRIRLKRLRLFRERVEPGEGDRILDVGGTPAVWMMPEADDLRVTMLNLTMNEVPESEQGRLESVVGNALDLPYADREFEVGFSNSVIEHVGTWENQVRFAENIRRVSGDLWVQTPARCFFFEPHYITPFIHWIPRGIRGKFVRWFTVWGLFGRPSKEEVRERIDEIRLLDFKEMKTLFPDCEILRERWLGLTKGYMACRVDKARGKAEGEPAPAGAASGEKSA